MHIKSFIVGSIGTNSYLVWDEESKEAMIVDPGEYSPAADRCMDDHELTLKYIALTHGHGDHIGGVEKWKTLFPDAPLLAAGQKEAELLESPALNDSVSILGKGLSLKPDLNLKEGDALRLGGLSFRVIETPGHTPGGITFYIQDRDEELFGGAFSGTAFTGDTLFQGSVGRTDLYGGDFSALLASIKEKLFALPDDTLLLPGHMDATTVDFEKKYNPFIR